MKIKKLSFTLLASFYALTAAGQESIINEADKKYDTYAYIDAINIYEKVAEKGYKGEKNYQRLGNAYYFNGEFKKALKWYTELFAMNENQSSEYLYRFAQCLKSGGDYQKAAVFLEKFKEKNTADRRGLLYAENKDYLEIIKANSNRFEIADAGINSEMSDYGSTIYNNKIVFASARDTGGVSKNVFKWTNKAFTNLYSADLYPDGTVGSIERFQKSINSKFNESTPVFTQDGTTMYFTRNNYLNGKRKNDSNKVTLLKLYKATLENGKWKEVVELPFNSDQYSVAHPALSPDEKTLYFASDMPGTVGLSDLYKVAIYQDGTYGKPENLGPTINTEGRETFPFISGDKELYFASDGHLGLGGLDVFVSAINSEGEYEEVQNVGEPINTPQDDFAFMINSKNKNGFVSSNRDNGVGFDDVYRFVEKTPLLCRQVLKGTVKDVVTGEIIADTDIVLYDEQFKVLAEGHSDLKGHFVFKEVSCGKKYYLKITNQDYQTQEIPLTIRKFSGITTEIVLLEKRLQPITVGTDLAKVLEIPIIYFDLDKAKIKKESTIELEKIVEIMSQYPSLKLAIRSHTDSRQTAKYNQELSEKRAKATMKWLVEKGVPATRLTARGYGETQLVNDCSDGVSCSEEQHQLNRRSEFIITNL